MDYKAISSRAFFILGTFFVTCLPINASAAGRCESVFNSKVSYLDQSMEPIRTLSRLTIDFRESYLNKPQTMTQKHVDAQLAEMKRLAELYFEKAGIPYEVDMAALKFNGLQDVSTYSAKYPVYKLKGNKEGDEISRMIYGVLSHPLYKKKPVIFEFDILHSLKNNSVGHYEASKNTITIGPYALSAEISGLTTTVRHEIQHYYEQIKILEKKQTTARISFSESKPKSDLPYSEFYRLDEIETHLRDLRTSLNFDSRAAKDKLFAGKVTPETWNRILEYRKANIAEKIEILEMMLTSSDKILTHLKQNSYPNAFIENHVNGQWMGAYLLDGYAYSVVRVDFYGLFSKPQYEMSKAEISKVVDETLAWNHKRVNEVRAEVEALKKKAASKK